jgi:16S rRNA C967 or C1407 C5-methylase (RsmB/RsmF family)
MEFFDYYEKLFAERWPALLESLKGEGCATELRFGEGLEPYYLDEASVFAAKALGVVPGEDVLDMCAAPGGKTLVIASMLKGEGSLQSNDRSPDRRLRLQRVIENSLPEAWRSIIKVTGYDGMKF